MKMCTESARDQDLKQWPELENIIEYCYYQAQF